MGLGPSTAASPGAEICLMARADNRPLSASNNFQRLLRSSSNSSSRPQPATTRAPSTTLATGIRLCPRYCSYFGLILATPLHQSLELRQLPSDTGSGRAATRESILPTNVDHPLILHVDLDITTRHNGSHKRPVPLCHSVRFRWRLRHGCTCSLPRTKAAPDLLDFLLC